MQLAFTYACRECGKYFTPLRRDAFFCCEPCQKRYRRRNGARVKKLAARRVKSAGRCMLDDPKSDFLAYANDPHLSAEERAFARLCAREAK